MKGALALTIVSPNGMGPKALYVMRVPSVYVHTPVLPIPPINQPTPLSVPGKNITCNAPFPFLKLILKMRPGLC